jgi:acyl-CoA synthetase (AMP-forming)/AMP-acid ligase II
LNISELLAGNARDYGDEVALVQLGAPGQPRREISWAEFDTSANRLANQLRADGVGPEHRVLHLMRNSIDWLIAYFGILRTGAWVVPLNFRFTAEEIKFCAEVAEASLIIFGDDFTERVATVRDTSPGLRDYICVGENRPDWARDFTDVLAAAGPEPTGVTLNPDDPCGLYFTSGTTGTPKPILLTHRNLAFSAEVEQAHHRQTREDNFILIPPLYHTGAKMHWFGSLLAGSRGTLLAEVTPQAIFEAVSREGGTIVWLLVPWAQDILAALDRGELRKEDYDLSRWRLMHIGAQPVPPSLITRWQEYFPGQQYDTNYGLSESTGPGCVHLGIDNLHKVGAIGVPGYGWETRIVDEADADVADEAVGELIVRGDGVMREYYKNPEQTAAALKDGWLHTGDMVRRDADGFIFIVDRKKDVIISGGENIFPVEVETVLHYHFQVLDVAVIGLPDARLGEIAVAVITPKPGQQPDAAEVMAFAEARLPRFKRPKRIIFGEVPRNPTGKIEKPKLRERYGGSAASFNL